MHNPPKLGRAEIWRAGAGWAVFVVLALGSPRPAAAHPLGAQSVDHYSEVEITPRKIIVVYDVDMAEVATFQAMKEMNAKGDGAPNAAEKQAYADAHARAQGSQLQLEINGRPLALTTANARLVTFPGQTALPTLRLISTLETAPGALEAARRGDGPQSGSFRDDNDPSRIGWRQISIRGVGTQIVAQEVDGHLARVSPQGFAMDAAGNQSEVRAIAFRFRPAATPAADSGATPEPVAAQHRQQAPDAFSSLLTTQNPTLARMWWLLVIAAGLGGVHALSPGHGKTLVAAYLVGARGTPWHAVWLGLIVTVTHTAGVFALGLVTLFASRYLLPETLYPWLTAISGLVIAQIGLLRLFGRGSFQGHSHGPGDEQDHVHFQAPALEPGAEQEEAHSPAPVLAHQQASGHSHNHEHAHDHGHSHAPAPGHTHDHDHDHGDHGHHHVPAPGEPITWRSLLALGVSGGLVPCPSALVVLLSAVALHQIGLGLALIVAFSAGLAAVLTVIGLVMVSARDFVGRRFAIPGWVTTLVPRFGAALIAVIGLAIAAPAIVTLVRRY